MFSKEEIIELETARRVNKDKRAEQRLHAVLLRAQGKACKEAAQAAGYKNWKSVSELVGKYKRNGIAAIAGNHYGGNRRNLSLEEERKFIDGFKAKAEKGELVTVKQIKIAYCKLILISRQNTYCR